MVVEQIRYAGQYRFERHVDLARTLARAREQLELEDDLPLPGGWMRAFVVRGAAVTIDLAIPACAELRFAAAELFETLARAAVDGLVEATIAGRRVDDYPSGGDADD